MSSKASKSSPRGASGRRPRSPVTAPVAPPLMPTQEAEAVVQALLTQSSIGDISSWVKERHAALDARLRALSSLLAATEVRAHDPMYASTASGGSASSAQQPVREAPHPADAATVATSIAATAPSPPPPPPPPVVQPPVAASLAPVVAAPAPAPPLPTVTAAHAPAAAPVAASSTNTYPSDAHDLVRRIAISVEAGKRGGDDLLRAFRAFDSEAKGSVSVTDFTDVLMLLGHELQPQDRTLLQPHFAGAAAQDCMNYPAFVSALMEPERWPPADRTTVAAAALPPRHTPAAATAKVPPLATRGGSSKAVTAPAPAPATRTQRKPAVSSAPAPAKRATTPVDAFEMSAGTRTGTPSVSTPAVSISPATSRSMTPSAPTSTAATATLPSPAAPTPSLAINAAPSPPPPNTRVPTPSVAAASSSSVESAPTAPPAGVSSSQPVPPSLLPSNDVSAPLPAQSVDAFPPAVTTSRGAAPPIYASYIPTAPPAASAGMTAAALFADQALYIAVPTTLEVQGRPQTVQVLVPARVPSVDVPDRARLEAENADMRRTLSRFSAEFFDDLEDLKYRLHRSEQVQHAAPVVSASVPVVNTPANAAAPAAVSSRRSSAAWDHDLALASARRTPPPPTSQNVTPRDANTRTTHLHLDWRPLLHAGDVDTALEQDARVPSDAHPVLRQLRSAWLGLARSSHTCVHVSTPPPLPVISNVPATADAAPTATTALESSPLPQPSLHPPTSEPPSLAAQQPPPATATPQPQPTDSVAVVSAWASAEGRITPRSVAEMLRQDAPARPRPPTPTETPASAASCAEQPSSVTHRPPTPLSAFARVSGVQPAIAPPLTTAPPLATAPAVDTATPVATAPPAAIFSRASPRATSPAMVRSASPAPTVPTAALRTSTPEPSRAPSPRTSTLAQDHAAEPLSIVGTGLAAVRYTSAATAGATAQSTAPATASSAAPLPQRAVMKSPVPASRIPTATVEAAPPPTAINTVTKLPSSDSKAMTVVALRSNPMQPAATASAQVAPSLSAITASVTGTKPPPATGVPQEYRSASIDALTLRRDVRAFIVSKLARIDAAAALRIDNDTEPLAAPASSQATTSVEPGVDEPLEEVAQEALTLAFERFRSRAPPTVRNRLLRPRANTSTFMNMFDFSRALASLSVTRTDAQLSAVLAGLGMLRQGQADYAAFVRFVSSPQRIVDLTDASVRAQAAAVRADERALVAAVQAVSPKQRSRTVSSAAVSEVMDLSAHQARVGDDVVLPARSPLHPTPAASPGSSPRSSPVLGVAQSAAAGALLALRRAAGADPWAPVQHASAHRPKLSVEWPTDIDHADAPFWAAVNELEALVMREVRRRSTVLAVAPQSSASSPGRKKSAPLLPETPGAFILRRAFEFFDRRAQRAFTIDDFHATLADLRFIAHPARVHSLATAAEIETTAAAVVRDGAAAQEEQENGGTLSPATAASAAFTATLPLDTLRMTMPAVEPDLEERLAAGARRLAVAVFRRLHGEGDIGNSARAVISTASAEGLLEDTHPLSNTPVTYNIFARWAAPLNTKLRRIRERIQDAFRAAATMGGGGKDYARAFQRLRSPGRSPVRAGGNDSSPVPATVDAASSRAITPAQFKSVLGAAVRALSDGELQTLVDYYDVDGDGTIDFVEFLGVVSSDVQRAAAGHEMQGGAAAALAEAAPSAALLSAPVSAASSVMLHTGISNDEIRWHGADEAEEEVLSVHGTGMGEEVKAQEE